MQGSCVERVIAGANLSRPVGHPPLRGEGLGDQCGAWLRLPSLLGEEPGERVRLRLPFHRSLQHHLRPSRPSGHRPEGAGRRTASGDRGPPPPRARPPPPRAPPAARPLCGPGARRGERLRGERLRALRRNRLSDPTSLRARAPRNRASAPRPHHAPTPYAAAPIAARTPAPPTTPRPL